MEQNVFILDVKIEIDIQIDIDIKNRFAGILEQGTCHYHLN